MSDAEEPVVEEPAEEPEAEDNNESGGEDEEAAAMESAVAERGAAVNRMLQQLENTIWQAEEAGRCSVCFEVKVSAVTGCMCVCG